MSESSDNIVGGDLESGADPLPEQAASDADAAEPSGDSIPASGDGVALTSGDASSFEPEEDAAR